MRVAHGGGMSLQARRGSVSCAAGWWIADSFNEKRILIKIFK